MWRYTVETVYGVSVIVLLIIGGALAFERTMERTQTWWKRRKARQWRRMMRVMRNPVSDERSSLVSFKRHVSK